MGMLNLQRRLRKLEAGIVDCQGLIRLSPKWLEYWNVDGTGAGGFTGKSGIATPTTVPTRRAERGNVSWHAEQSHTLSARERPA